MVARVIRRAWEVFRQEGARSLFFKIRGETVYRRMIVLAREISQEAKACELPEGFEASLLDETGIAAYCQFRPEADPEDIRRRLLQGHRCFAVWRGRQIVYACWYAQDCLWIEYLGCEARLAAESVYGYDAFTRPEFRGQNLWRLIQPTVDSYFRNQGVRRVVLAVMPENTLALKVWRKAGSAPVGTMRVFWLGRWRIPWTKPSPPDFPITLHAKALKRPCGRT